MSMERYILATHYMNLGHPDDSKLMVVAMCDTVMT